MSAVAECLFKAELGEPQSYRNLSLFPLLADGIAEPDYLLLDEALERGCARVSEVSEQGSVPELRFVNECDRSVLLIDGEELVGAKQNRILNLSILVPAHKTIVVPVSCHRGSRALACPVGGVRQRKACPLRRGPGAEGIPGQRIAEQYRHAAQRPVSGLGRHLGEVRADAVLLGHRGSRGSVRYPPI